MYNGIIEIVFNAQLIPKYRCEDDIPNIQKISHFKYFEDCLAICAKFLTCSL